MDAAASPLVDAATLASELAGDSAPVLLDARWRLGGPPGAASYLAVIAAGGGTTASCQVGSLHAMPCEQKAEVKLADAAGDKVWACLTHADEILMAVAGAFIATESDRGIAGFLSRRHG